MNINESGSLISQVISSSWLKLEPERSSTWCDQLGRWDLHLSNDKSLGRHEMKETRRRAAVKDHRASWWCRGPILCVTSSSRSSVRSRESESGSFYRGSGYDETRGRIVQLEAPQVPWPLCYRYGLLLLLWLKINRAINCCRIHTWDFVRAG